MYFLRKHNITLLPLLLAVLIILSSCSGYKHTYLPIDASVVKKGDTMAEVREFLGPPSAILKKSEDTQEWYYFDDKTWFWQRTPLLGKYLGDRKVESLLLILKDEKVVSVTFYVNKLS